ncbi:unnamed protein product [Prorocentrum cordatum]|uniref:Mei2-like C-terminal RNA recognition motif domain-containing protein n=1 Tax=Prorocentrum cordatum TaxID=2364126 RepID=A0ABN9WF59_9DINO|nr:unnamed protein product [Polarella glacialis]
MAFKGSTTWYLPMDFKTSQTLGYGFVNAVSPEIATRIFSVFDGFQAWPKRSLKTCSVCWSERQGLESNVRVYRNLGVMKHSTLEAWKPALFSQGSQVPFPAPTRRIRGSTGRVAPPQRASRRRRQGMGSDGASCEPSPLCQHE